MKRTSAGGQYRQVIIGEWSIWHRKKNRFMCCDCSLIHVVDFRLTDKNRIEARYFVDQKATNRARKTAGIKITRNEKR